MSYRVDIPTLSANEVYTLTFEYEGTETIQLIVGDLTLETTDRRVVFTTTSPVNYIESNVNLTNLNMYEGYYESDDFGGEYTQESYIEGMSLVNLIQSEKHLDFQNDSCGVETFEDNMIKLTITDVSSLTSTWQRGWMKTSANLKVGATYTCVVHVVENSISTEGIRVGASYGTLVHGSDSNLLGSGETGVVVFTYTTATATLKNFNGYYDGFCCVNGVGDWQNGSLKYGIMIFEGDYYDYFINSDIPYFEGVGCVKSPKIVSYPKYPNIAPNCKRDLSNVTPTAYRSDDNSYIKITNTARWVGVSFGYYPQDFGYGMGDIFCLEFDVLDYKGTGTISNGNTGMMTLVSGEYLNSTGGVCYIDKIGHYKEYFICNGNSENGRVCLITVHLNTGTGGINTLIEIDNLKVYKIDNINDTNEYEEGVVSTPDDLELYCNHYYDRNAKKSNPCYQDTLDLTTGTITRKNIKARLNDYIAIRGTVGGALVTVNGGDMVRVNYEHTNSSTGIFPVQIDGEVTGLSVTGIALNASQGVYDGKWFPTSDIEHAFTNTNTIYMFFNPSRFDGIDYTDSTTIKNWLIEQDFTLIMKIHNSSAYTEQLPTSINPLKSYYNGSIQTSSQQLAPTLKTTLPISNKFTTTNLTSGSTYNVYFDGTATKLDAGGTIITNPVSPCEVECGGTTLTIEGTDIQNVRVLETTVKNEVGSVSGTTDVELSRIITSEYENMVYDNVWTLNKTAGGASVVIDNDNKTIFSKGSGSWAYSETKIGTFPKGVSLIHVECDIEMKSGQRVFLMFGNGVSTTQYNFRDLKLNNDTATICQGNSSGVGSTFASFVTKGHFSNLLYVTPSTTDKPINLYILTSDSMDGLVCNATNCAEGSIDGYTICGADGVTISNIKIRVVENYPDDTTFAQHPSLIRQGTGQVIWQDMNMSMPQTISDLEQPIKLRSLGTTYDSYNPVTGELVKRIGVSETDGSYSVLSSPIVMQTRKTEVNGYMADKNTICKEYSKGYEFNTNGQLVAIDIGHYTDYYIKIPENTKTLSFKGMSYYKRIMIYDENKNFIKCYYTYDNYGDATGNITSDMKYVRLTTVNQGSQGRGYGDMRSYLVTDTNYLVFTSDTSLQTLTIPHLYTNGQVKVYSDSDVYPTTILNGQSTNNYEVNGLNKSNNYTIRYDGTCESINLANKSNEQGTNRIVKSGTDGRGNLTFVNSSGDINNVLLVEHDVREQEINYFTGLETVEVSGILIETSQNMWWNDWIAPSEYGASWQVDSPEFISVQPGETIYVVANNNNYTSLLEFDENYNIVNQGKDLILSNEANPKPVNLGNNYYKNYRVLSENTRYIKFIIPVGTATTAKNEARWSVISFTKTDVGNVPLYTNNTPYRGSIINLPQPVQLNRIHKENMPHSLWSNVLGQVVNLADGITYDSYNPITGEYIQRVYKMTLNGDDGIKYIDNWDSTKYVIDDNTLPYPRKSPHLDTVGRYAGLIDVDGVPYGSSYNAQNDIFVTWQNYNSIALNLPRQYTNNVFNQNACKQWLRENPITLYYELETPITTQLTPINIPTFEGGIVQLITTDGKVFPMVEYSMPTNNRYDTSSWEAGKVYTQRNMTEAYFNESTTPMIPTETMTLTTDHISSGSIILNDNGNGLIVLKGNYTGRDIPYFTGMRSVEAIEVETTPSPDQPLFGKGGRK